MNVDENEGDLTATITCPHCCGRKGWTVTVPDFHDTTREDFLPCSLCYGTGQIALKGFKATWVEVTEGDEDD